MSNYHYQLIINQKQLEIEENAKQAWKFADSKQEGTFQKIMKLFKATPTEAKSNSIDTCIVC